jgi:hypothetical protein
MPHYFHSNRIFVTLPLLLVLSRWVDMFLRSFCEESIHSWLCICQIIIFIFSPFKTKISFDEPDETIYFQFLISREVYQKCICKFNRSSCSYFKHKNEVEAYIFNVFLITSVLTVHDFAYYTRRASQNSRSRHVTFRVQQGVRHWWADSYVRLFPLHICALSLLVPQHSLVCPINMHSRCFSWFS